MLSGVSIICFAASYAVNLGLELAGLIKRFAWQRVGLVVAAVAGLTAHTLYLSYLAGATDSFTISAS